MCDLINDVHYLYYIPAQYVACGTKSGVVWLLNGTTLETITRIPRATFPIVKIVFSKMNEYFAYHVSKIINIGKNIKYINIKQYSFRILAHIWF